MHKHNHRKTNGGAEREAKNVEGKDLDGAELEARFLGDMRIFLGPDPEIMQNHDLQPRSELEERALRTPVDDATLALVRSKLQSGLNEAYEMMEQMGAAPGAKWGDLISGIYSCNGDLALGSSSGVLVFALTSQHPVQFMNKYWKDDPTVGIREGDVFMHNDARYGTVHNTDQTTFIPIFHQGEQICWVGVSVHEGENGAVEPGGMPSAAESPYMEGLKMSPFKIGENYEFKRDLVTFLQNSVREPKLIWEDMKCRLTCALRVKQRIEEAIGEFGLDAFVSTLRRTLEDTRSEVQRRLRAWPDATVRTMVCADSTLRENAIIKICLELRKKGDELVFDFRGSAPEIMNRANNTVLASLKGMLTQLFLNFVWPDLPRTQGAFAPIRVEVDTKSALNCSYECANAQSMMTFFPAFTAAQLGLAKYLYSSTERYTDVIAPWFNMINTFIYGGVTQYGEMVGNLCADLNGMGGGAHPDRDGEHAIAPIFCAMADLGEQEVMEQEVPFMQIVSKRLMRDNQAFGKHRGGMGYQVIVATKDSSFWGFMTTCIGSKLPNVPGLFGGYGCTTYPLCKVKGVDLFEVLRDRPESFPYTIEDIMNDRPWPEATYTTHHMGMQFELAKRGELYMLTQGSGGGYGDVLDRDPALVIKDLDEELISAWTAENIYRVVYDPGTRIVDVAGTERARADAREERKRRGVPFDRFVKEWVTDAPPADLPFFGSWNDRSVLYAGKGGVSMSASAVTPVMLPDPRDVRIAELEAKLAAREQR